MNFPELAGRTVLLTGGANGIGAAMARAFCRQGAEVFFCDVDARAGRRLAAEPPLRARFARVGLRREREGTGWNARIEAGTPRDAPPRALTQAGLWAVLG